MKRNKTSIIVALIVFGLLFGLYIQIMNNNQLPVYNEKNNNQIMATIEPYKEEKDIPHNDYSDDKNIISLKVPTDFRKILKDGSVTFVHPYTSAYIEIQELGYKAGIHGITEQMLANDIANIGGTMNAFSQDGNFGYTINYTLPKDDETLIIQEITRYDLNNMYRIIISVPDKHLKDLKDKIDYIVDNIKFTPQTPIPINLKIFYSQYGNYEFAVPISWNIQQVENAFVSEDKEINASLMVKANQSNAEYSNINQAQYQEYIQGDKTSISVKQFVNDGHIIYAVSSFKQNDFPYVQFHYMLATGQFEYEIMFIVPLENFNDYAPIFDNMIKLFKIF